MKLASGIEESFSFFFFFFPLPGHPWGCWDIHLSVWTAISKVDKKPGTIQTGLPGLHCTTEPGSEEKEKQRCGQADLGANSNPLHHQLKWPSVSSFTDLRLPHPQNSIISLMRLFWELEIVPIKCQTQHTTGGTPNPSADDHSDLAMSKMDPGRVLKAWARTALATKSAKTTLKKVNCLYFPTSRSCKGVLAYPF